jgi:hypothetical protein
MELFSSYFTLPTTTLLVSSSQLNHLVTQLPLKDYYKVPECLSSRLNWIPHPLLRKRVAPPHLSPMGGAALACGGEVGGIQFRWLDRHSGNQCCGSEIRCLFDPWIRDPKTATKERGEKNICCHTCFCSHKFRKIEYYFIFEMLKKKIWANFQRFIEVFTQIIVTKLPKISVWDLMVIVINCNYPCSERGESFSQLRRDSREASGGLQDFMPGSETNYMQRHPLTWHQTWLLTTDGILMRRSLQREVMCLLKEPQKGATST